MLFVGVERFWNLNILMFKNLVFDVIDISGKLFW